MRFLATLVLLAVTAAAVPTEPESNSMDFVVVSNNLGLLRQTKTLVLAVDRGVNLIYLQRRDVWKRGSCAEELPRKPS